MNKFLKTITGMGAMTDQVIATDFLVSSKSGVLVTALALTEAATPELRDELHKQLNEMLDTHDRISDYMIEKGYYHPHELSKQLKVDRKAAETALGLADD